MKIAVVIPKYGLMGGAESFAYELTEKLAENHSFEIHVFANQWRQGTSAISFHKVPIMRFPRFMKQMSFAAFSKRRIRRQEYDLIHSHDRIFQMDLMTMHGIPHETWVREVRQKSAGLFDRSTAWVERKGLQGPEAPLLMPVSSLVKEELLKRYAIPASKLRVIHPGVSEERFSAADQEKSRHSIRQHHGLSPDDVVVLFVGMNFEIKRLELVMKGISQLKDGTKDLPPVKLIVVGKGHVERYRRLANSLGIGEKVVFAGVIQDVGPYFLGSDVFAMPSHFDTFGLAVLEALTAGLPVIISRSVGARDLIHEGHEGFILNDDPSPEDFCERLKVLLDREGRRKMGERARKVGLSHTWEHTARKVMDCYSLCAPGREKKQLQATRNE